MNYKNWIPKKEIRLALLKSLGFIPDKTMVKLQYKMKTGRSLDLYHPTRYTEKLQWYKLYYQQPLLQICSNKYDVRQYVTEKGYGHILNPLYRVFDSPDEITFDGLPNQFAIKCSTGGELNYFVLDKSRENIDDVKKLVKDWYKDDSYIYGREWCYKDQKPKILIEKLLPRNNNNDIPDYKFFCFDGKVFCLYTMVNYVDNHEKGELAFFDQNFNKLPYYRKDFNKRRDHLDKPKCFDEMVKIAEDLSQGFPHVRVDLYDIDDKPVFGEFTFYNASGYMEFDPDEFDFIMGSQFHLPIGVKR